MEIIDSNFHLGENEVKLTDKYEDIERLVSKTGIKSVWETNGSIISLAVNACKHIINDQIKDQINILILVTQSPDDLLPANSITLAHKLNLKDSVFTFDFNQGCSGFVQAFVVLKHLISTYKTGLIITADCYRKKLNPEDRSTNAVFSDGAAAVLLKENDRFQILFEDTITDGSKRNWLYQSTTEENGGYLYMSGSEIWIFTRKKVVPQIQKAIEYCRENSLNLVSIYIHQASKVVVDGIKNALGEYGDLILENYMNHGNTVSSTIPILLNDYPITQDKSVVIFSGFGVGLTSTVIVYGAK